HYEYSFRVDFWWELVKRGIHPRVALVMQAFVNARGGQYSFVSYSHGHQVFDSTSVTLKGVKMFRDNALPEMKEKQKKPIRNGFENFNQYFNGGGTTINATVVHGLSMPRKVKNALTGKEEFKRLSYELTITDMAKAVAELCKEYDL
ncbi:MAG TPA: hypothetical protein V6D20_16850, partial [Candidatus Obscuribacterales bacterium]